MKRQCGVMVGLSLLAAVAVAGCGGQPLTDEDAEPVSAQPPASQPAGIAALKQAAAAGDMDAQYKLGVWYEDDYPGSPRDLVRAYAWYTLAMEQGDLGAQAARERFAEQLTAAELAKARALVARWKPGDTLEQEPGR